MPRLMNRSGGQAFDQVVAISGRSLEAEAGDDSGGPPQLPQAEDPPILILPLGRGDILGGDSQDLLSWGNLWSQEVEETIGSPTFAGGIPSPLRQRDGGSTNHLQLEALLKRQLQPLQQIFRDSTQRLNMKSGACRRRACEE